MHNTDRRNSKKNLLIFFLMAFSSCSFAEPMKNNDKELAILFSGCAGLADEIPSLKDMGEVFIQASVDLGLPWGQISFQRGFAIGRAHGMLLYQNLAVPNDKKNLREFLDIAYESECPQVESQARGIVAIGDKMHELNKKQ